MSHNSFLHKNALPPRHFDLYALHLAATYRNIYGQPLSKIRVQKHLAELRPFFRWLYQTQQALVDHGDQLKPLRRLPNSARYVPSVSQVLELLALPDLDEPSGLRGRAMLETVYGCGLRLGELVRLALEDIDFEAGACLWAAAPATTFNSTSTRLAPSWSKASTRCSG